MSDKLTKKFKPIIAVTGPDSGGLMAWLFTALNIKLAGGIPLRVRPKDDKSNQLEKFDGLILGGGTDLAPSVHGEDKIVRVQKERKHSFILFFKELFYYPTETFNNLLLSLKSGKKYDPQRDLLEKKYLNYALSNKKPVLGICRGHQLVNVVLGGTLLSSTSIFYEDRPRVRTLFPRKKVISLNTDSLIAKIFNKRTAYVNALHNQAVDEISPKLDAVLKEKLGIVQALENKEKNILTVQWHPEYLPYRKDQRSIFSWLVHKAKTKTME